MELLLDKLYKNNIRESSLNFELYKHGITYNVCVYVCLLS